MTQGLFAYALNSTASEAILGGFLAFGLCAVYGGRLIYRGIRRDVLDASGQEIAAPLWFILAGVLMQIPLIAFAFFVWKQGFFR